MDTDDDKIEPFRRMFCAHYPRLVRLAVQMTGDEDEARDIVADVMETAWRRFGDIDQSRHAAWLRTCVHNACVLRLKHRDVERRHSAALAASLQPVTETESRERERLLSMAEAVAARLEEPTRSIINMCYYRHLTHRQAADSLGISPETVKKHIRKALRMMREEIERQEE